MHDEPWLRGIVSDRTPMEPIGTDVAPQLQVLKPIRAVVFDVYGTLIISGSGDVGSADLESRNQPLEAAIREVGLLDQIQGVPDVAVLHEEIRRDNESRRSATCPSPEVDIVNVWRHVLARWGVDINGIDPRLPVELAVAYERRANPTWPMPGASELLRRLRDAGFVLGIVSNAQIFTLPLVTDLLGQDAVPVAGDGNRSQRRTSGSLTDDLAQSGFDLDLCIFSNRFRQSKPGPRLFDALRGGLQRRGIAVGEAVYVGNDRLNDMWAASQAGLRTAWFAGDRRSCRARGDDPRCQSLVPDVILGGLMPLLDCLEIQ